MKGAEVRPFNLERVTCFYVRSHTKLNSTKHSELPLCYNSSSMFYPFFPYNLQAPAVIDIMVLQEPVFNMATYDACRTQIISF